MRTKHISQLLLERYRLGEVSPDERTLVEEQLSLDNNLRTRLDCLEISDRELRSLYPFDKLPSFRGAVIRSAVSPFRGEKQFHINKFLWGLAAAVFLCVLFPSLYFINGRSSQENKIYSAVESGPDRIKGTETKTELSIYLRENLPVSSSDEGHQVPDQVVLSAGNTIQLAYTTSPGQHYGVIFSIDERAALTLHYPYRKGQSPVLAAGKRTFLNEAYTLDDAPGFEVFFMVVSQNYLDTEKVLTIAGELAKEPETALAKSAAAFSGCEVETITIRKTNGR